MLEKDVDANRNISRRARRRDLARAAAMALRSRAPIAAASRCSGGVLPKCKRPSAGEVPTLQHARREGSPEREPERGSEAVSGGDDKAAESFDCERGHHPRGSPIWVPQALLELRRAVNGARSSGSSGELSDPTRNSIADGDIDEGARGPGRAGIDVEDCFFQLEVN